MREPLAAFFVTELWDDSESGTAFVTDDCVPTRDSSVAVVLAPADVRFARIMVLHDKKWGVGVLCCCWCVDVFFYKTKKFLEK